jgi:hypothetical protein
MNLRIDVLIGFIGDEKGCRRSLRSELGDEVQICISLDHGVRQNVQSLVLEQRKALSLDLDMNELLSPCVFR